MTIIDDLTAAERDAIDVLVRRSGIERGRLDITVYIADGRRQEVDIAQHRRFPYRTRKKTSDKG